MENECTRETATAAPRADTPPDPDYVPKPLERAAAQRLLDRMARNRPAPRFKVAVKNGKTSITPDHVEPTISECLLTDMLASSDTTFAEAVLYQLANVARSGKDLTSIELNAVLATVNAIGPRDPTEALLAVQMAAIHNATMVAARRLVHVDTLPQQDSASNMLNKLARTFAAQVEALKKYRSTGEQSIRVQHVTVNDGGKAIVGDVRAGGGATTKTEHQPHGPSESSQSRAALLSHSQTLEVALPSPGGEGLARLPLPRSKGRSADRQA